MYYVLKFSIKIGALNEIMKKYVSKPEYRLFRSENKLQFSEDMRAAFGRCVGDLVAVPVEGVPGSKFTRYVIEVDITPHAYICKETIFAYWDVFGALKKRPGQLRYMRVGSANLRDADPAFMQKKSNTFETRVSENADWRKQVDLVNKRTELQQEVRQLEERTGEGRRAQDEILLQRLRSIETQLSVKIDTKSFGDHEAYQLMRFEVEAARSVLNPVIIPRRSLNMLGEIAQLFWPAATQSRTFVDLPSLARHFKGLLEEANE